MFTSSMKECCGSEYFFQDPALTLISDPDFFNEKYIWTTDHLNIAKKLIFTNLYIFGSGLFMKNTYELQII